MKTLFLTPLCLAVALLLAVPGTGRAQAPASFPFVLPWDDATPGVATDVSFLNVRPAGAHGFIVAKGGHFVEADTGRRVRFLGVNLAAHDAFPAHADAAKVAARLAKFGVNLVRLHHMDNDDWGPGAHVWDDSYKDRRHLSPAQLDKLDYLIAQLKKNGIYVNLNLHVSRRFTAADGFPASVAAIPFGFDQRVDEFDRRMILLQKEYARQLLTHVNPFTHLSYAQDPCVAVVEINNENSLVGDPWADPGVGLDTLPAPFKGELVGLWNAWLAKKYATDVRLKAAWLRGATPLGPNMALDASSWFTEHQGTAEATASPPDPSGARLITVTKADETPWHVQATQPGLDFRDGATYTVSFQAWADAPRAMPVNASVDQNDWHSIGLSATADLTTNPKTFHFVFQTRAVVPQHGRVVLVLGGQTGKVYITGLNVRPGAEGAGLPPGQSLAARTVDFPTNQTPAQRADWLAFLAGTERAYVDGMRAYLKTTLHVHASVIGSQVSWGGLSGVSREAGSDFADNHAYWQHPSFPHKAWDPVDWNISNTPMVSELADGGDGGVLRGLAEYRVAGKPYSVSEYNEPAPNDFQAEAVPELATFGAFQDWDMLYLFDYGAYGAGAATDKIPGYFAVGPNPAKMAFFPAAALIFRAGALAPSAAASVLAPGPSGWGAAFTQGTLTAGQAWNAGGRSPDFLGERLSLGPARTAAVTQGGQASSPPALRLVKTGVGEQYIADGPGAVAVVGYVGGQTVTTKAATFTFPAFGNNFAALTLTPLDGQPIAVSRHLLLTVVGKVENQDMHWNADRTSVGDQWGHGPVMAEGIPASVTLHRTASIRKVYALDTTGRRAQALPVAYPVGRLVLVNEPAFQIGPQYQTVWYEIVE